MSWITPVELVGEHVILKPLNLAQVDSLAEAVCDGNSIIFGIPVCQDLNKWLLKLKDVSVCKILVLCCHFILKTEKQVGR